MELPPRKYVRIPRRSIHYRRGLRFGVMGLALPVHLGRRRSVSSLHNAPDGNTD